MTDKEIIIYLAEKVMGWTAVEFDAEDRKKDNLPRLVEQAVRDTWWLRMHHDGPQQGMQWNPLENIADSFEVNEKLGGFDMIAVDDGWMVGNGTSGYTNDEGRIEVKLEYFAIAETLPRAICMSAVESTK